MIHRTLGILAITLATAAAQTPFITSSPTLPTLRLGQSANITLSATGGIPPYTWSLESGKLNGLTLTPAGKITGTPSTLGNLTIKAVATDSATPTRASTARIFKLAIIPATGNSTGNSTGNFTGNSTR